MNAKDGESRQGACYFFAGGGTGGHLYPAIAVAERLRQVDPAGRILFLCSRRSIDSRILSEAGFDFVALPGRGFSIRPDRALSFVASLLKGYELAKKTMAAVINEQSPKRTVVIGIGGFASAPSVLAGARLGASVAIINVDIVPGRANRFLGRFASRIFVQFPETAEYFGKIKQRVIVSGCPLREGFAGADADAVIDALKLAPDKKTLVVTGASSGSLNINRAIAVILGRLDDFADDWQVVHLTGSGANSETQRRECDRPRIHYHLADYFDNMAGLYACADLIVGRAGAVSVAEFAASGTPAICMPYPYHKDRHQYRNAAKLVDAGAAVVVDDIPDEPEATAEALAEQLQRLMTDDETRRNMASAAIRIANISASADIARNLLDT